MKFILFSKAVTEAIAEVESKIPHGLRSAPFEVVSKDSKELISRAHQQLEQLFNPIQNELSLPASDKQWKRGRWQVNGYILPYLWATFLPSNVQSVSAHTPQLYFTRKRDRIEWGLTLSDSAKNNPEIRNLVGNFFLEMSHEATELRERGFSFVSLNAGEKKFHTSFVRELQLDEQVDIAEISLSVRQDLEDLFPYFLKLSALFIQTEFIGSKSDKNRKRRTWLISPGRNSALWDQFVKEEIISVGWNDIGDLRLKPSKEAILSALKKSYGGESDPTNTALALFQFSHEVCPGDKIIVKDGVDHVVGFGHVTGTYAFDSERANHSHIIPVQWQKIGRWNTTEVGKLPVKTLTEVDPVFSSNLFRLAAKAPPIVSEPIEPYSHADAISELFFAEPHFLTMIEALRHKKNIILQGPPGVGKTFVADRLAYALMGSKDKSRTEFVQFHPSYSYEDFVQGYRPTEHGFSLVDGLFYEFCIKAAKDKERPYVFVIDEINRGNLSKIFGELMVLLEDDKRGKPIKLTYSKTGEHFSIPENVHIIGTMNTADRSLNLVDYALRRRFLFFDLQPEFHSSAFAEHLERQGCSKVEVESLSKRLKVLNEHIVRDTKYLGPGFQIGHSYFCKKPTDMTFENWIESVFKHEIEPLLREYWFDDQEKAKQTLAAAKAA